MSSEKKLLQVLSGTPLETPPVWFMRQAGRYLPEYREVRSTTKTFLEFCYTPKKAAEVTLQPIRRFSYDASIIFSDILVVPNALGVNVRFEKGEGPKLKAITRPEEIEKLVYQPKKLSPVYEAVTKVRTMLPENITLLGFSGAPWTLITYMIEGQGSKNFDKVKTFSYQYPDAFSQMVDVVTEAVIAHLVAQVDAGADALQIFDSWAGAIPDVLFERVCIEPFARIVSGVKEIHPNVPIIGFPRGVGAKYKDFAQKTGVDALSIDQFTSWQWACESISVPIQGNLDPVLLATDIDRTLVEVRKIMEIGKGRPYVFNLGHGILPHTPIEHVERVLAEIKGE